jgi:hypothetical protein
VEGAADGACDADGAGPGDADGAGNACVRFRAFFERSRSDACGAGDARTSSGTSP